MKEQDLILGFQDESAQRIWSDRSRVWSVGRPVCRHNTSRINANVFGFYAINGISVSFFPERSRKEDMCRFLDKVREANGERRIVMILDNCPIHRSAAVREHAALRGIVLLFLPPYSPQFNPIELIWKTVKRAISRAFLLYRDHLVALVEEVFAKEAAKASYVSAWKADFLSNIILKS